MIRWLGLALLGCGLVGCGRQTGNPGPAGVELAGALPDEFLRLMNAGKNALDQGDGTNALAFYRKAETLVPNDADLRLNLANACLVAGDLSEAVRQAEEVLKLEPNSAAAYFVKGSAQLRASNPQEAVKALENVRRIDPGEIAACFQLGKARMELKLWEEAAAVFKEGIALDPNHLHRAAHYLLAQSLLRAGRTNEAQALLQQHASALESGGASEGAAPFERSKYTQARVPFRLDQPASQGVKVRFVDATPGFLGASAGNLTGPVALLDPRRSGWTSLLVREKSRGFRPLWNTNGAFTPGAAFALTAPDLPFAQALVGDLQNDRGDDVVVLGESGSRLYPLTTNAVATEVSTLNPLDAIDGLLMDLDFTGRLDLLVVTARTREVRVLRQSEPLVFKDVTASAGIPPTLRNAQSLAMEDWNRDGNLDVIVGRQEGPPLWLEKQRGGPLVAHEMTQWVAGSVLCAGDFDNDLRPDLAIVSEGRICVCFNGGSRKEIPLSGNVRLKRLVAVDYDNDGWLDLWGCGDGVRAWRNLGLAGFRDETAALGLDQFGGSAVTSVQFADFDRDCDPDAIVTLADGGLRCLRNEGANANAQVKVRLVGNRSNASGLGCKVEIETGGLRLVRLVQQLPVEIGVGRHQSLDSFLVHWSNWPQGGTQMPFDCKEPLLAPELTIQEGSCPYLYAWDGERFRFVTDVLGAAPLGLPVAEGHYTDADPEELVWVGDERSFPARGGYHEVRITEELREVLYLDEAKLVVVDQAPGTEVHSTDKLLPKGPFPRGQLVTLHREHPLIKAEALDGRDVTDALRGVDGRRVSPPRLRAAQLRGLAEPHGWVLDFGPLDPTRPLVLVMNGWIRFGGGMANIAASHDPSLPFPFPALEAEVAPGTWRPVDVVVGAPAGKTKTILVDLEGKLAPGTRRLRLTQAFEIHWDRIALLEKRPDAQTLVRVVAPTNSDLRFRGFGELQDLPPDCPLTPDYDRVSANSPWTIIPGGWCTRYGDVSALVARRDEGLVLVNSGDELSLKFAVESLPTKPADTVRQFFLYLDGWDKDSDFHVKAGTTVEPLPFHGMQDARYGQEVRPAFSSDALHRAYNTRWVDSKALKQTARR